MKESSVTFKEATEGLAYVKVLWNGKKVFDDYYDCASLEDLRNFENKYNEKIVYSMYVEVVDFHHYIIEVEGEDV